MWNKQPLVDVCTIFSNHLIEFIDSDTLSSLPYKTARTVQCFVPICSACNKRVTTTPSDLERIQTKTGTIYTCTCTKCASCGNIRSTCLCIGFEKGACLSEDEIKRKYIKMTASMFDINVNDFSIEEVFDNLEQEKENSLRPLMPRIRDLIDGLHVKNVQQAKKISKNALAYSAKAKLNLCQRCIDLFETPNGYFARIGAESSYANNPIYKVSLYECDVAKYGILYLGLQPRSYSSRKVTKTGLVPFTLSMPSYAASRCELCKHKDCEGECVDGKCNKCN